MTMKGAENYHFPDETIILPSESTEHRVQSKKRMPLSLSSSNAII